MQTVTSCKLSKDKQKGLEQFKKYVLHDMTLSELLILAILDRFPCTTIFFCNNSMAITVIHINCWNCDQPLLCDK